jgi:hypothetical protein
MARKSVLEPYKIIDSISLGANYTSGVTSIKNLDNIWIELEWSGTAPSGTITVEVASEYPKESNQYTQFKALDFGSPIVISGASGTHTININQAPMASVLRLKYAYTSGTGTINAYISGKVVGA